MPCSLYIGGWDGIGKTVSYFGMIYMPGNVGYNALMIL